MATAKIQSAPQAQSNFMPVDVAAIRTQPLRAAKTVASGRQKLFAPITNAQRQTINNVLLRTSRNPQQVVMKGPTQANVNPSGSPVTWQELYQFTKIGRGTLPGNTLPAYLEMIAAHVNRFYARDGIASRRRLVPAVALLPTNFEPGTALRVENLQNPAAFFEGPRVVSRKVSAHMTANMMSHQPGNLNSDFFQIKHILVPIASQTTDWKNTHHNNHTTLLVISPQAKTIEHLDPGSHTYHLLGKHVLIDALNILTEHLGRDFIPTQWKIRTLQFTGQNRLDMNCTYIAAANAMCIAFGYAPDYMSEIGFNMSNRIQRMCAEMIHGCFDEDPMSDYYYPIIDRAPLNSISDHWITIPPEYMADIRKFASRARTGKYDHLNTFASLRTYVDGISLEDQRCGRRDRYASIREDAIGGVMHWGPDNDLHNAITTVEIADWKYAHPAATSL